MEVETSGYKRATQQNIELSASGPVTISIAMEAGSASETVEIRGHAPAIEADGGAVSMAIDPRNLHELPVIDRNHQQLVGLMSGVTPPQPAADIVRDPDQNRSFSVNGQPPTSNLWTMEGVMNLEPFRGSTIRVQPLESVQQLNVTTATLPAEQGFAAGGVMSNLTRPGSNDWHGSLFEFYSGNVLRTRSAFQTEQEKPRFVYNQMGATFGGPLVKDKTFIFGSYEGTYQNGSNTVLTTVPTAAMIGGNFSGIPGLTLYNPNTGNAAGANRIPFSGNMIPASLINPTAATIAGFLPSPNQPGFANNLLTDTPFQNHGNKADGRIDHRFNDRATAFVRYGFTNFYSAQSSPLGDVIGAGTRDRLLAQNAVLGFEFRFSPGITTEARVGYNRYDQKLNPLSDETPLGSAFGPGFANNLIGVNISGLAAIGSPATLPERAVDNTLNAVWNWGWHTSRHNLRWGIDARRIRSDGFTDAAWNTFGGNGAAFFGPGATLSATGPGLSPFGQLSNSFGAFLLGAPSQVGVSSFLANPTIRQTQIGAWIGDTIQLAHRISVDLGVRYEAYGGLSPSHTGGAAIFDPLTNTFSFSNINGVNPPLGRDINNFAPRIGVSARLTEKTVVRAGYSIQYFQNPYMLSGLMAPMFGSVNGVQGGFTTAGFTGAFGPTVVSTTPAPAMLANGAPAGNLPATVLPPNMQTPYVQNFNFRIQQEFYGGTVLSAGYVGALGRHLPFIEELNAAAPGTGVAGLPFEDLGRTASTLAYGNGLTSNYNALQVNLTKRFAQGLSFIASYTFSKALGYTGSNEMLLNPFNLAANYGPLDYDHQHILSISHLWEIPFGRHGNNVVSSVLGGWQVNGVFTWNTGAPLTITADPVSCDCPGNTLFASLNGAPVAGMGGASFFNPAAFTAPINSFGNLGRGALRGPDIKNYDLSLFKNFKVHDRFNFQLRGEAYNLTNTAHFAPPITNIGSPAFGESLSTTNGSFGRQVNLALRVVF